eukprot:scaffold142381_cov21-Tisochrysis_lutea.AAC.1
MGDHPIPSYKVSYNGQKGQSKKTMPSKAPNIRVPMCRAKTVFKSEHGSGTAEHSAKPGLSSKRLQTVPQDSLKNLSR